MEEQVKEFIDVYIEGSSIEKIEYSNTNKKWTIYYNYDIEPDEFDSFKEMRNYLQADQFGE